MAKDDPKANEGAKAEQAQATGQTPQSPPQQAQTPKANEGAKAPAPPARPFDAGKLLDDLAKTGTGKAKLAALAAIKANSPADWYAEAERLGLPGGTLAKVRKLLK